MASGEASTEKVSTMNKTVCAFHKASKDPVCDDRPRDRLLVGSNVSNIEAILEEEMPRMTEYNPPYTPTPYRMILDSFWPTTVAGEWKALRSLSQYTIK